jgi:hypothetical protein
MTAYHGSPYLFPRFDPKRIGTGEGNQVYGVGAGYTAEARPVAEKYALDISNRDMANQGRLNAHANAKRLADLAGNPKYAADDVRFVLETNPDHPQKALLTKTLGYLESGSYKEPLKNTGYLYKGDIPDEIIPKFLDYDAPLKNQSPEVQALAKSLGMDLEDLGGDLLGKVGKNVKGTLQMQDAGIKGIKYLDQGSRGQGKGTSNFIPFSPNDFKIQEINDEPLEAWLKSGRLQVDESDPLMQFLGQK